MTALRLALAEALGLRGGWRDNAATILRWVAASDGEPGPREQAFLRAFSGDDAVDDGDLAYACAQARRAAPTAKVALVSLAVDLALLDAPLHPAERLALETLADALGVSEARFDAMLARRARPGDAPARSDPSQPAWHKAREQERARAEAGFKPRSPRPPAEESASASISRARAMALMGFVSADAITPASVRAAFRRLAQTRHPDRFAAAPEEVQREARLLFDEARAAARALGAEAE